MDCFVASLLAITSGNILAAHLRPSDAMNLASPKAEGAGNAGCTPHPLPCVQNEKGRTQANTGTPKSLRHSLRNGVTAAPRSSWCAGLVSHHRLRKFPRLESSIGGPQR